MISVIIPVYNGAKFIDNAVESVINQSFGDWELLIVNDGSTDDTAFVIEKYASVEKIRIINQENQGVSAARNNAARESRGSHIAFLDADDIWHINHLEVMNELILKYPSAGLYGTFTRTELANKSVIEESEYFKDKGEEVYLVNFFAEYHKDKSAKMFTVITTCISREAFFKTGGFPVGCTMGEDLEMSLVTAAYFPVVLSKKATATYKKELSTATKDNSFDAEWGFFERAEELYRDEEIPEEKRESLKLLMNWFTMRRCRHYIIDGKRKKAWNTFFDMDKNAVSKKDVLINLILLCLPTGVVRKIFAVRWRGKA